MAVFDMTVWDMTVWDTTVCDMTVYYKTGCCMAVSDKARVNTDENKPAIVTIDGVSYK